MTRLYLSRQTDTTDVLFDFTDADGSDNPRGVRCGLASFDKGTGDTIRTVVTPDIGSAGRKVYEAFPPVSGSIDVRLRPGASGSHADVQYVWTWVLEQMNRPDRCLVWVPDGGTEQYLDLIASAYQPLQRGGLENLDLLAREEDSADLHVDFERTWLLRFPMIAGTENVLKNSTLLIEGTTAGRPRDFTWSSAANITNEAIDAEDESYQFDIAIDANRDLRQETAAASFAPGDVLALQIEAAVVTVAGTPRARVRVDWLDNVGAVISGENGTLTTLTTKFQTLSLVSAAAPASTDRARISVRFTNLDTTSVRARLRRFKAEETNTVKPFTIGRESVPGDPSEPGGVAFPIYNPYPSPALLRVRAQAQNVSSPALTQMQVALTAQSGFEGERRLAQLLGDTSTAIFAGLAGSAGGWTVTLGADTAAVGTDGPGGVAHAYIDDDTFAKRVTLTRTTQLQPFRGRSRVFLVADDFTNNLHEVQLRYSPSLEAPATHSNPPVELGAVVAQDVGASGQIIYDIGEIVLPEVGNLDGLLIELWTRGITDIEINLVGLLIIPANDRFGDQHALLTLPGAASDEWLPLDMHIPDQVGADPAWTLGTLDNDRRLLDAANEGAAIAHVNTTGRHSYEARMSANAGLPTYKFRVVSSTDNVEEEAITDTGRNYHFNDFLQLDVASGDSGETYEVQVVLTNVGTSGKLFVYWMKHSFQPVAASSEVWETDAWVQDVRMLDSSDDVKRYLTSRGTPFLVAPPGLSVLWVMGHDVNPGAGYHPDQAEHLWERDLTVTVGMYPTAAV